MSTRVVVVPYLYLFSWVTCKVKRKLTFLSILIEMKLNPRGIEVRRKPAQKRAQMTVQAMLDAATKLVKRGGASVVTTNRIAETAGVSIGSVYQYFPNKRAIFIALHERHIGQVDCILLRRMHESEEAPLEGLILSLIDGMIEAHSIDPELFGLLQVEVPHHAGGSLDFSVRLHGAFRSALALHAKELGGRTDLDMRAFFVSNMVEALGHAIVSRRPHRSSLSRARAELLRAILAYLRH